jgi:hypothetical protein
MEVKELILKHKDFLSDFGYKLDRKSFQYTKNFAHGKKIVFFHHTHHEDVSYIEYHAGIRYDIVELIVHQFLPSLGDYKDKSITLIETLDGINPTLPKRRLINHESEINQAIRESEELLASDGFKWLDKFASGPALERYFNETQDQALISQNFTYRSARGVTLCKLFNPNQFDEVKNNYLTMLDEMQVTPFTLACFLNLLNYLKTL